MDVLKVNDLTFQNMGLVENVMGQIADEQIIKYARHGEEAIARAQPIEPLMAERQTLDQRESW